MRSVFSINNKPGGNHVMFSSPVDLFDADKFDTHDNTIK
jgi:hypothetical protein